MSQVENTKRFSRNIFITQSASVVSTDNDFVYVPVVKETAKRLLDTGSNTLQHTLLLRKEMEAELVESELASKRQEFTLKLSDCSNRYRDIMARKQAMQEKTKDAADLIYDQTIKQRRALRRCELDAHDRMELEERFVKLKDIAEREAIVQRKLKTSLNNLRKSSDFLNGVINALPTDYITGHDDPLKGLIGKHSHLVSTKDFLTQRSCDLAEELKNAKATLRETEVNHGYDLIELNGKLRNHASEYEHLKSANDSLESQTEFAKAAYKNRLINTGNAFRAIDCLVERGGGAAHVRARGTERSLRLRSADKRKSKTQQSSRPQNENTIRLDNASLTVILNGISAITQSQKEVAAEATRRTRRKEITFTSPPTD